MIAEPENEIVFRSRVNGTRFYFLCLVLSDSTYFCPDLGVGGKASPLTQVTSVLVDVFLYCADTGTFSPGENRFFSAISLPHLELSWKTLNRPRVQRQYHVLIANFDECEEGWPCLWHE